MPDVRAPPPCDHASAAAFGSPPGCASPLDRIVDMEPCIANLPLSPNPLSTYCQHRPHYPGLQGPPFPLMARCNSSTLLTNMGLRYCSSRHGPPGVGLGPGLPQGPGQGLGSCGHTGSTGSRPYRSMENLSWNTVSDSGLCTFNAAPYRSMDSEFILRYTATSHWYDGPPDGSVMGPHGLVPNPESLAFYPRHGLPRKDLPLFPQLLFPVGIDELEARKGLREKLRLQSARSSVEPLKPLPLRPQVTAVAAARIEGMNSGGGGVKPPCTKRITSPEEIKQEALRRLRLRRQNSSPNLALHGSPSSPGEVKTSYTTDNIAVNTSGSDSASERRRPPVGRLHIPTFEEFKRMRQKEDEQHQASTAGSVVPRKPEAELQDPVGADSGIPLPPQTGPRLSSSGGDGGHSEPREADGDLQTVASSEEPVSSVTSTHSPIRTGPSPRSPLQPLASSAPARSAATGGEDGCSRRRRSSLEPAGSIPFQPNRENWERPSSCCPALLLEGADLSSYGAKIYKMKDGLIGSALDLIKKR